MSRGTSQPITKGRVSGDVEQPASHACRVVRGSLRVGGISWGQLVLEVEAQTGADTSLSGPVRGFALMVMLTRRCESSSVPASVDLRSPR